MTACEFCKFSWIIVFVAGALLGVGSAINGLVKEGEERVCYEAYLSNIHLNHCDTGQYPVKNKTNN